MTVPEQPVGIDTARTDDSGETPVPEVLPEGVPDPSVADRAEFRRALRQFATGVTLATTATAGEWHGATANAVISVSLEPPLVLLSITLGSRMDTALRRGDNYALSILAAGQAPVARYFADSTQPHNRGAFARFPHRTAQTGAPLLDGALAHIDCRIEAVYPGGDHLLYLGRVVYLQTNGDGDPLLYLRGEFR